ncbi:hypothetical protein P153DRAFT_279084 [Dothidotthia symphoricarpi CBS 119687]|uniref:Uncharacterized protein n=1 Tax=Dothidotthia symphoricarpi CBS 119687 TaxID=1392245 RepID=A0A6A6AV10_9PLEO|nr:uncharacterized protein P153DRAFT_279084 [Dothidotthia symphoricarpi CBS 119687]KAF2134707.1 hypothetical protein P153DRAFT_279084 [Dothidotthia symphoricarpi CBS 119687]
MDEYEEAVLFTFALLETRLDRLEYLLSGPKKTEEKPKTIPDRIHNIEKALQQLAGKTSLLVDAQELINKHKDVLIPEREADKYDLPLDTSQKAVLVVERATGFATTASQLKVLQDQQVPSTDGFTKLAMLRPRIAEAENRHLEQALKISELRKRTGLVVQRYKQVHLVGAARCWVSWHGRCQKAYRTMAREEFKRKPEEHVVEEAEADEPHATGELVGS